LIVDYALSNVLGDSIIITAPIASGKRISLVLKQQSEKIYKADGHFPRLIIRKHISGLIPVDFFEFVDVMLQYGHDNQYATIMSKRTGRKSKPDETQAVDYSLKTELIENILD
jgi:hypothetical protein